VWRIEDPTVGVMKLVLDKDIPLMMLVALGGWGAVKSYADIEDSAMA